MGISTVFVTLLYDYMDGDWLDILVSFSNFNFACVGILA